jgi:hypothetical protein
VLAFAMLSHDASAEIRDGSTTFSLICKAEHSIGFNYVSNSWQKVNFKPSTYIVTKLDPVANKDECCLYQANQRSPEPELFSPDSLEKFPDQMKDIMKHASGYGCYRLKELGGSQISPFMAGCSESWYGVKGNAYLKHVDCENFVPTFAFDFDGAFAATYTLPVFDLSELPELPGVQDSDKSHRDSVYLEIGNCAQVR